MMRIGIVWKILGSLILVTPFVVIAGWVAIGQLGGAFSHQPEDMGAGLSASARGLVERAFADVEPGELRDYHTHILGLGTGGSGTWLNPKSLSWRHPIARLKALVYFSAADITDMRQADAQYVGRLVRLIRAVPGDGKYYILAFDHYYRPDGTIDHGKSNFFTPNDYVFRLSERYPDIFIPAISIHPYRPDALDELEKWARRGARMVKWLPNAQGIDAADPRNEAYYRLMKDYDMVLLSHVGEEQAVEAAEDQEFGNPLRFRLPLDIGVKVVMAHAASLGDNLDLDNPGARATSFDLFMRLMDEPKYDGLLFGEISAIHQYNRLPEALMTLLRRKDLHHRLVNGGDYPLPAVNFVIHTGKLVDLGLITKGQRQDLNEIYDFNPLLFDYVLKRTLRLPGDGTGFPPNVFTRHPALGH